MKNNVFILLMFTWFGLLSCDGQNVPISQLPALSPDSAILANFGPIVHGGRYYKFTLGALDSFLVMNSNTPLGFWSLTGNAGTDPSVNFIGTLDNTALNIIANKNPNTSNNSSIILSPGQNIHILNNDSSDNGAEEINMSNSTIALKAEMFSGQQLANVHIGDIVDVNFEGTRSDSSGTSLICYDPISCVVGLRIYHSFGYPVGSYGVGKVLTSDASGNASWQNNIGANSLIYDTLTDLSTGTINLTNNAINIIVAASTYTSTTFNFPSGHTNDKLTIINEQGGATLIITGTGTGTISSGRKAVLNGAIEQTFYNYGGNWY